MLPPFHPKESTATETGLKVHQLLLKSWETFPLCRTESEVEASKLHTNKISAMEPFKRCRHDASSHLCSTWEMFKLKLDKSKTIRQTDDEIYEHSPDPNNHVCVATSSLLRMLTSEFLTIDVLRKNTLLQMAEKRFMLS